MRLFCTKEKTEFMINRYLAKLGICIFCILCSFIVNGQSKKYTAFQVKVTGQGQPVLLIPGATCSGDEWNETVAHLGGKYQCHVLTIAGFSGVAPLAGAPYLSQIKDQIAQYIVDEKLDNVILGGHSIGGFFSLWIASEMKDHLQKVIVVDAMPFFAGANNPAAADTFSEAQAKSMFARYNAMDDKQLKTSQLMTAKFMCLDSTRWDMIATWGVKSDKKTMAYAITEMMSKDMRKLISKITVPVLVLAAYHKMPQYPQFTRESVVEVYKDQYKECTKCVVHTADDNTAHFIMYDNPQWFYKEMDTFLKSKL